MVAQCEMTGADRWMEEQLFEEDVRAVVAMLRPNRQERLAGWTDYRTGGKHFRATISWDEHFELNTDDLGLAVPRMAEVLESILIGSVRNQDELSATDEFELYRRVIRDLYARLNQMQACYE